MNVEINYDPPGPVAADFIRDDSFVCGIMGPIGSGKSTAAVIKLTVNVLERQPKGPSGKRKRRTAIIRNTYPELKTTTIKTWHQWWPADAGRWREAGPPQHTLQFGDVDWEVIFVALDRPEDVKKLLSMELSDAWVNEAREVPRAVLDGLTGRVGRYPPQREGGCACPQVIMDTNPPDSDHWWYRMAEEETPPEWRFFRQPAAMLKTPGGYTVNPAAENLPNLPESYYERAASGKHEDWVKVYVLAEYGYVQEGKPVYPEYQDSLHCREMDLAPKLPLLVGIDFGLTPAAIIGQRQSFGGILWRSELVATDMGAVRFGELLAGELRGRYAGYSFEAIIGDPAGDTRAQTDEETAFRMLRAAGVAAYPANTNDWNMRREAVAVPLSRLAGGYPGLVIHPDCKMTRKGMMGGYRYRRVQVAGDERYHDMPDKNAYSHPCEAGQYLMLGAGEGTKLVTRKAPDSAKRRYTPPPSPWAA